MHSKLTQPIAIKKAISANYAKILKKHHLKYQAVDHYYQVGHPEKVQGWILHLSPVWTEIPDLLTIVLPLFTTHNVPFKIVQDKGVASTLNQGGLGYHQLGKVFCIYPPSDEIAMMLARELLVRTKDFKGCTIPTDFHLGGILYARYGSFNPKIYQDKTGRPERYIYDANGQLIKDEYNIPFKFPKGVHWPFKELAAPEEEVLSTFLNNRYKVFSTLKTDAKGRVMKALRLDGFHIQWIIIKEAKQGICIDEEGRDIQDRLNWQHILQNDLQHKMAIPQVYDFFKENGNSYLAMEYIKGKHLGGVIDDIFALSCWNDLDTDKKSTLLDHLMQLVDTINVLHQEGYMHRDLNWMNFILDKQHQLVAIDLELAYSIKRNFPHPPFRLGTPGLMSPEQVATKEPQINQDIYSLGALMIKFFTNLAPMKFERGHPGLVENLNFFTGTKRLSDLIAACVSSKPADRPDINNIKSTLENFRATLATSEQSRPANNKSIDQTMQFLIHALGNIVMIRPNHVWHSNTARDQDLLDNHQAGLSYDFGLYTGVSGVMYTLANVKCAGHDIGDAEEAYSRAWQYLSTEFLNNLPNSIPGLYYGAAGVAMGIAKGIEAKLIDPEHQSNLKKCLEIQATELDVAYGVAGQGLAVLHCLNLLGTETAKHLLDHYVNTLLENQQKDGSWLALEPDSSRTLKYTGFSQGVTGICFFLLKYYEHYKDEQVQAAATKALRWLQKKSRKSKEGTFWLIHNRKRVFDRWLNDGTAGIALCFITAYKVLGDPNYKKIAENTLAINPRHLVYHNFSLASGMAGLAEVYLTAARVFEDDEWQARADFILDVLMHAYRTNEDNSYYWIVDDNKIPTADLMVGNSGILHFFLRYLSPETSSFL
ncbi:lanthionine synthetase LanC family protein [Fulvivirgaceae bacterium BMA12]|uniref:Lanthionine synthetase LanC family protein n=1 Tax=Agaribacillus aureus TaxID=3051825 RepID=A0ABT8L2K0_9BACT|nr:lanthionine synthetase LanC family protein [Fulvivirgaceae bacterium BMA12]